MYKNQKSKIFVFGLIIVLFLGFIPQTAKAAVSASAIFNLTNSARTQRGLGVLSMNSQLNQAAQIKAQNMLDKDYFAHTSPQGLNSWYWFKQVGYNYKTAGENLAIDFSDSGAVFSAWMASASHRANILDPDFRETGIAVLAGEFSGSETTLAVQMFGTRYGVKQQNSVKRSFEQTSQNQKNNLITLNDAFQKFKIIINNINRDLKQIFIKEVFLVMLL